MIRIKIKIGPVTKEYNLKNEDERNLMINNILLLYISNFPFFINTIMALADIEDVGEEERKKGALAYTYYNYQNNRIKIHLNFEKMENLKFGEAEIIFLIFHEYLHNYFYHMTRMEKESKDNPEMANIVMDYYVNELLLRLFKRETKNNFTYKNIAMVEQEFLEEASIKYLNKKFPYDYENKPIENKMYEWFKQNCPNISLPSGCSLDSHEIGKEKEEQSMEDANSDREKQGKDKMSKQDMQALAKNSIETTENNIKNNYAYGRGEEMFIREKEKITQKNPFLNMLKLQRIINSKLREHYVKSYRRLSRKRDNSEIIFKGKTKQFGQKVVVALDVSGSISDKDLKLFYEMLAGFVEKNKETSLDVIYWSSCDIVPEVNFHQNVKDINALMKLKMHSSGGTEIEYLNKFIEKYYGTKREKIVLINITDGYFYMDGKIPEEVIQYFFVLTEPDQEEKILKKYKKVKTVVIKDFK